MALLVQALGSDLLNAKTHPRPHPLLNRVGGIAFLAGVAGWWVIVAVAAMRAWLAG